MVVIHKVEESQLVVAVVTKAYEEVLRCMSLTDKIQIDLTNVDRVDTAGIALILAWWQYATEHGVECHFKTNDVVKEAVRSYSIELP